MVLFISESYPVGTKQLRGPGQGQALRAIEANLENIQAAWEWTFRQRLFDDLSQAVDALGVFYLRRARFNEGVEIFNEASQAVREVTLSRNSQLLSRLLTWQAAYAINLERFREADLLLSESDSILCQLEKVQQLTAEERIFYFTIQTFLAALEFNPATSLSGFRQITQLSRKAEMKCPRMFIFFWRFLMGGAVTSELYLEIEKNLDYVKESGDPFELACILYLLGIGELYHNFQVEKAEPMIRESIQHFQKIDDISTEIIIFKLYGYLSLHKGNSRTVIL